MNHGPLLFFGAFVSLVASWFGLILVPQVQFGRQPAVKIEATGQLYAGSTLGEAVQGAEIYRANGCNYCHSQQPGVTGMNFKLVLTDEGTNTTAFVKALTNFDEGRQLPPFAGVIKRSLPRTLLVSAVVEPVESGVQSLTQAGAKAVREFEYLGPDVERGWARRPSVAQDYQNDAVALLGSQRLGPDLANVGSRRDAAWHYLHLYAPSSVAPNSKMPSYKFLFEERPVKATPSSDALKLPAGFEKSGVEVVPTDAARQLVAYLLSRRFDAPLPEAPVNPTAPATSTNAPAGGTNAPVMR